MKYKIHFTKKINASVSTEILTVSDLTHRENETKKTFDQWKPQAPRKRQQHFVTFNKYVVVSLDPLD